MTSDPLERATDILRGAVSDPGDVDALPAGREVAVARIAAALRERAAAHKRRRRLGALAAAAAVLLLASGGAFLAQRSRAPASSQEARVTTPRGGVTVTRSGRSEEIAPGERVVEGAELHTAPSAEAHLDFESGSHVTLGGNARLRLVQQSAHKRFALEAGSFSAKVAKLGAGERFVVTTPDSEIEVRGTAFRVELVAPDPACSGGTPTRLAVDEGVVVVRHANLEHRVGAGERWPACEPTPVAPTSTSTIATAPEVPRAAPSIATSSTPHPPEGAPRSAASPEASSHLAEQNDLFDEAVRAKRTGDAPTALAKLDRLRRAYPNGPLAENAEVERFRVLAMLDRRRAAEAAREYLRRRPSGFARSEAEALAAAAP